MPSSSRISGACNGCRAKKQKCSGDRAGCTQCIAAGIECTWPQQRKRGPAKGYIEALEMRLHSAETLLLALLPMIDQRTLSIATGKAGEGAGGDEDEDDRRASPVALNKKTGIDYWEAFPIDTNDGVRRWQRDCEIHSHGQSQGTSANSRARPPNGSKRGHDQVHPRTRSDDYQSSVAAATAIAGMRHGANSPGSANSRSYDQSPMPISVPPVTQMAPSMPLASQPNWIQLTNRPAMPQQGNPIMARQGSSSEQTWIDPQISPNMVVDNSAVDASGQPNSLYSGQFQPSFFW